MTDILSKASIMKYAMVAVVAMVALYLIANHTSADTANKFGLTYVGTA